MLSLNVHKLFKPSGFLTTALVFVSAALTFRKKAAVCTIIVFVFGIIVGIEDDCSHTQRKGSLL